MVFIYHRLYRPHVSDFESIPKIFRDIFFKISRHISLFQKNIFKNVEPKYPLMKSKYPGPNTKNLLNDLELCNPDFMNIKHFIDYNNSYGNYFQDCDGNTFLDFANFGNKNILGYNSKIISETFFKNQNCFHKNFINKCDAITNYLDDKALNVIEETVNLIKPSSIEKIIFTKKPEELAYLLSIIRRGNIQIENYSNLSLICDQINSFLEKENDISRSIIPQTDFNIRNFSEEFKILKISPSHSLKKYTELPFSFYGKLSFKHCNFPEIKYPLKENMRYNYFIENKCLEEIEKVLKAKFDISAILIETVADGEKWATPTYFYKLRKLASLYNVDFIVDERKTGLTVGRIWQHELWNLHLPPDFIVFGNKFLNSGLFIRNEAMPEIIYNFYSGNSDVDISNMFLINNIIKLINKNNYFEKSEKAGEYFKMNLKEINKQFNLFSNIRGKANLIAFDVNGEKYIGNKEIQEMIYNKLIYLCRNSGIFIEGNEHTKTIFVRPNIIVEKKHYDIFLNTLDNFINKKIVKS